MQVSSRCQDCILWLPVVCLASWKLGRCFSLLFERRHSSDYDDFAYSSEEEIDELLPKATAFIEAVGSLLEK